MLTIAIDGACRRNGKPDCTASGGVFYCYNYGASDMHCGVLSAYEYNSTNQRGELLALLKALDFAMQSNEEDVLVVTDSEYIFNAMNKRWFANWHAKGWRTASDEPVKNKDIWLEVKMLVDRCEESGPDIHFYHIKGHCIPFGRVTADKMLKTDPTGRSLLKEVQKKFDSCAPTKQVIFDAAQELSVRNNGFAFDDKVFKQFVVMNTMADAVATKVVDAADSSREM